MECYEKAAEQGNAAAQYNAALLYEWKAGEKNLYYVSADKMLGDDGEATADGSHFTDLGMMRYVENIMPIMKKALK